ncbi:hypothetical protein GCM10011391_06460 [Pullulanibacillus camelliae]|uniref:Glycerophosphotransferase n=1 Tax=Pullulanibacillus camelliae TaxID=1707096 RepID=A0A8J2YFU9_9BACL|nr:CDP-glycerol glycerophosphotransferase family protein [Pullulanibacillus camelliae]GGE30522.1 hypothetical protein GCM10011391_06460 [Pullulanibacillus camelliae]
MRGVAWIKKCVAQFIVRVCNLMPIKQNKLFFMSYYGDQYGCNPKYIYRYIVQQPFSASFDIVWALNTRQSHPDLSDVRQVKMLSLRYFYELCTAKIIITNCRTTDLFMKRKGQYYIQTWHSSLRLKQIEKDAERTLSKSYIQMAKKDSRKCDLLLSGCQYSTEIFKRSFWYDGLILEKGTPRNDLFFASNQGLKATVLNALKLPSEKKMVLYAPTFRKDHETQVYDLNYSLLLEALTERFGGEWIVLVRLHPHMVTAAEQLVYSDRVIDVSTYDDCQELLCIADVLVSDYSSLIFDYALTRRPCFLYVPDLNSYIQKERQLYFDLEALPFEAAVHPDDFLTAIRQFDQASYHQRLANFLKAMGSSEEGEASKYVVDHIYHVCFGEEERRKHVEAV